MFQREPVVLGAACVLLMLALAASAQYPAGYGYPKPAAPSPSSSGPNLAGGLSTFGGNPYKSQFYPPTGLATGSQYGFGSRPQYAGNPMTHQPVQKPYSNLQRSRPLVSSMDAARISVTSGLWGWGY